MMASGDAFVAGPAAGGAFTLRHRRARGRAAARQSAALDCSPCSLAVLHAGSGSEQLARGTHPTSYHSELPSAALGVEPRNSHWNASSLARIERQPVQTPLTCTAEHTASAPCRLAGGSASRR